MRSLFGSCLATMTLAATSACHDALAPVGELFVRFKANGVAVEYRYQASLFASFDQTGPQFGVIISATNPGLGTALSVQAYDGATISTGTYSGYRLTGGVLVGTLLSYRDESGVTYISRNIPGAAESTNATVVITEMSDSLVRGTFDGMVTADGRDDISISEGEFLVGRAN